MEAIEIKSVVIHLFDTEEVGEKKFKKRDIAVEILDGNPQYPEQILLQGIKDLCDTMDELQPGTEVTFHVNLKGRAWTDKNGKKVWFNTLQIWKFDVIRSVQLSQEVYNVPPGEESDLPF